MSDDNEARYLGDRIIMLRVKAGAVGHENPWPNGTVVAFADHLVKVGGQGYRRLGAHDTDDDRWVKLPFETKGIVTDNAFDVEEYSGRIDVTSGRLADVIHMWYWVAFPQEFLWVRCDWLQKLGAPTGEKQG